MRTTTLRCVWCCAVAAILAAAAWALSSSARAQVVGQDDSAATRRIEAALKTETAIDFSETPLKEMVAFLAKTHDIAIVLNNRALEEVGIGPDTPVSRTLRGISLRSALRLMLRDLGLTYVVRDEVLVITTPEDAESTLLTRFYPVADLVLIDPSEPYSRSNSDFQELIDLIQKTIAPATWDTNGGQGAIDGSALAGALVVSQTNEIHEQIPGLLAGLRKVRDEQFKRDGQKAPPKADDGQPKLKVYRIQLPADPNVQAALVSSGQDGKDSYEAAQQAVTDLAKLVQETIAPESWSDEKGTGIRGIPGALVVRHDGATQLRVQKLLNEMGVLVPLPTGRRAGWGGEGMFSGNAF